MSKVNRMKKQAEVAKEERLSQAKEKIKEAGLEFIDYELPPDEVEQKEVERSLLTSFRTFIPYTNEWYEARAAEEEMDDLRKIRIEKVKAADLYTLAKIGKHEEALDQMMAETNNDFFFFNKMKYKMENEGKWHFDFKQNSSFGNGNRTAHRNRLRKAANTVYGAMDSTVTDELARLSHAEAAHTKRYDRSAPCNWRGKSKDNEALKCENIRMERPPRSDAPPRKKNEPLDILSCCAFHTPFCVSDVHEEKAEVKIKVPNDEGLCAECYMMKRGKKPPPFTAIIVPGVVPSAMVRVSKDIISPKRSRPKKEDEEDAKSVGGESVASQATRQRKKKEANKCVWQPHPDNAKARGYECCNEKFTHPLNGLQFTTCAWHITNCLRDHPEGVTSPIITIPNPYGLCAQHYLAEVGHPVKAHAFPLPGMQVKLARDHWKGRRHFAVPSDEPPDIIIMKEYEEPEPPQNWMQSMGNAVKLTLYNRQKRIWGKRMATRIQSWYRGCRSRGVHVNIKYLRAKYNRLVSAVRIQTLARRYFAVLKVRAKRLLANNSAVKIQSTWRGFWRRKQLRIDWAARRITKFMKLTFFFRFKDSVIMIMQLRRMFKRRMMLVLRIQRLFRGHSARMYVYHKRYWNIVRRAYAHKIQRAWKQHTIRRDFVPWRAPGEDWVLRSCAKKLSRMLLELFLDKTRRRQLAKLMHNSAPEMQRLVRGFLARAGSKKMAFLRKAMREWVDPRLAGDFMEKYLNSRVYFMKNRAMEVAVVEKRVENPQFIRKFLPEDKQTSFEVDSKLFYPAIEAWYKSQNMILLQSEKNSILRKFRNPVNGKVQTKPLDAFISGHKLPCRRHGRFICGDCVYRKNCQIGSCQCTLFHSSTSDGHGICIKCNHPGSLHSLCPLQMRQNNKANSNSSMLSIITTHREPDMSFPTGVTGIAAANVIIPAQTADDRRELHTRALTRQKLAQTQIELGLTIPGGRSLAKSLALCEIVGDTVHATPAYWDTDHAVSAVAPIENTADKSDTAIFDPVMYDAHVPSYKTTSQEFWNLTAKNPNKSVRDYHEKFDHNMPVPVVVNNEIVYSFEGPQIYFNLLNQIIRMDEKVQFDDPDFLKLVVDHIQLFERHWRKMVADIRTGKLDRNLHISAESRLIFETANIPKPTLAKRLDGTFRKLGFHMKVLGKDIEIRPYATKKKVGIYAETKPRRKVSLPSNALTGGVLRPLSAGDLTRKGAGEWDLGGLGQGRGPAASSSSVQLPTIRGMMEAAVAAVERETSPPKLLRIGSSPTRRFEGALAMPCRSATKRSMMDAMGKSTLSLVGNDVGGGAGGGSPDFGPLKRSQTKREMLANLGKSFCGSIFEGNTRPDTGKSIFEGTSNHQGTPAGTTNANTTTNTTTTTTPRRKRRGSFSEIEAKAITAHELNEAHYNVETAARDTYKQTIQTDGDRFVCPFPACGKSFHSKEAAFRHLPEHEQRTRLYAPTPLPDSHLNVYWPDNVPWLANTKYAARAIPPGSIPCTVSGCQQVFHDQLHLDMHLRLKHKIVGNSSQTHGYFKMNGKTTFCPPSIPPTYAPLKWCSLHSLPLGSCATCVEIDAGKGPKQPFRFFEGVTINLRLKRSLKLNSPNGFMNADAETPVVTFSACESTVGVVVAGRIKNKKGAADEEADEVAKIKGGVGTLRRLNSVVSVSSVNSGNLRRQGSLSSVSSNGRSGHKLTSLELKNNNNMSNSNSSGAVHEWRGRPVAMLVDRNENCWVAVEVLLTHQEAQQRGLHVSPDFDKRHQLLRPLRAYMRVDNTRRVHLTELDMYDGAAVAAFDKYIRWVPIHTIDRTFSLSLVMTQEEVNHTVGITNHLALRNKFFVEHSDVEINL